ncbi:MAG TPA: PIN domain-containing protein [Bryobacteraceae bacterium]|jgi:predicted nucleic acid-binding protein|nr:PIN domain-containing protein [Bryobacteraceae bacterium]
MSVLIDTNILLRSAQPTHPLYPTATYAVATLLKQNETIFFCPQNIAEFWHVATRPTSANGLGFSHQEALKEIESIEDLLTLLPETPGIYPEWKRIVSTHVVQGIKVFDARLIAVANTYGVGNILTFNVSDFKRYTPVAILDPAAFVV